MADDASSCGWEVVEAEDMEALAAQTAQIEDADLHASDSDSTDVDPHELEHVALSAAERVRRWEIGMKKVPMTPHDDPFWMKSFMNIIEELDDWDHLTHDRTFGKSQIDLLSGCSGLLPEAWVCQAGYLNSTVGDVEFITKSKKARTSKSGVTPGSSGNEERAINELITASDWWRKRISDYWRTATSSRLLQPKLAAVTAEMEANDFYAKLEPKWISEAANLVKDFQEGLRGGYGAFINDLLEMLQKKVEEVVKIETAEESDSTGSSDFIDPILKALKAFGKAYEHQTGPLVQKMENWYQKMKATFAQRDFKAALVKARADGNVDWNSLSKSVHQLRVTTVGEDVVGVIQESEAFLWEALKHQVGSVNSDSHDEVSKNLDVMSVLFTEVLQHEEKTEKDRILAQVTCGQKYLHVCQEFRAYEQLRKPSTQACTSLVSSWIQWKASFDKCKAKLFSMPGEMADKIITHWTSRCSLICQDLASKQEELEIAMEYGKNWCHFLAPECTMEQVMARAEETVLLVKGKKVTQLKDALAEDVAMAKDFAGKFANAGKLTEAADYTLLNDALKECDSICLRASKMKLEAMLLQAYKVKSAKSRKELVQCQFQELAGSDGLSETDIQPVLRDWAKSILT